MSPRAGGVVSFLDLDCLNIYAVPRSASSDVLSFFIQNDSLSQIPDPRISSRSHNPLLAFFIFNMRSQLLPHVLLLTTISLLGSAGPLSKRDPGNGYEIIYLTDCESPNNKTSQIAYYLDWKESFNGEHPIGWSQAPEPVQWENKTNSFALRADKGDYQTVSINPYSESNPFRAFSGVMNTSFGVYLPCFKDDGHQVYQNDPPSPGVAGSKCYSKFFCVDVRRPLRSWFFFLC